MSLEKGMGQYIYLKKFNILISISDIDLLSLGSLKIFNNVLAYMVIFD